MKKIARTIAAGSIDLLIIDIDDTFIYHRTVAVANKLFLSSVYELFGRKLREDRILTTARMLRLLAKVVLLDLFSYNSKPEASKRASRLARAGLQLHFLYLLREINNKLSSRMMSSERFIRKWAGTVVKLGIPAKEYEIPERLVENSLNRRVLGIYNAARSANPAMKVLAMSQSFAVADEPLQKMMGIDIMEQNRFMANSSGIICGFFLNVKNAEDKKKIAEAAIGRLKPKGIGLFVEDYDDYLLLGLKNISFVLYKRRLKRFIKHYDKLVLIQF